MSGTRKMEDFAKRVMDFAIALVAIIAVLPVLLLVIPAILLSDGRPVFFGHTRIGRGGVPFRMWKFRTMVKDAALGGYKTPKNDPRITRLGRILRKTSIDELPQFLNVLRGEMSLVGPRPDTPFQRELYTDQDWERRCSVRPGLTGLAQVGVKGGGTAQTRTELDLEYVSNHSLLLDMKIMLWTAKLVLQLKNN